MEPGQRVTCNDWTVGRTSEWSCLDWHPLSLLFSGYRDYAAREWNWSLSRSSDWVNRWSYNSGLLYPSWRARRELHLYRTGLFYVNVGVLTTCHVQHTWDRSILFFDSIEQLSKFLLHTLQVLYMCTICDSTNINTIIEFVLHVSGDGFSGGSDTYCTFSSGIHTHPVPWNGVYHLRLELSDGGCVPEFGAELPLDNCTPTIVLNNPVYLSVPSCMCELNGEW